MKQVMQPLQHNIITHTQGVLGVYSKIWYKPIPTVLLRSISRETQQCQF